MKRLLFVFVLLMATPCMAQVTDLPQDQDMGYISVVGEGPQYQAILDWFDEAPLKSLKDRVHFCPVTPDSAVYEERYKPNLKALPTIRMQEADGTVVYEVSGKNVPADAATLHASLSAATDARALLPRRRRQRTTPSVTPPVFPPLPSILPILPPSPPVIHTPILGRQMAAFGVLVMALAIGFGMAQTKGKS